jgi:hypothetical protein
MQIVARIEIAGKTIKRIVKCIPVDVRKIACDGIIGDAADREPHAIMARDCSAGNDGEIPVASGKLVERVAMARDAAWEFSRFNHFVVLARR